MRSKWLIYVIGKEGTEVYLCQCITSDAVAAVLRSLCDLAENGPIGYRISRIDEG